MSDDYKWFYLGQDDVPQGPLTREQLLELIRTGQAGANALVWRDGFSGWRPYPEVEEEIRNPGTPALAPAPAPAAPARAVAATARRVAASAAALEQVASVTREVAAATTARVRKLSSAAAAHARFGISRTQLTVFASFIVAAVAIVSTLYSYSGPVLIDGDAPGSSLPPIPASLAQIDPVEAAPLPVRVKNPFDASEVFEFPPGTPQNVARDKVADILMARAMERQKYLEKRTRTTKRR
jgi:GYF domain 2